jgi:hypothetical protein
MNEDYLAGLSFQQDGSQIEIRDFKANHRTGKSITKFNHDSSTKTSVNDPEHQQKDVSSNKAISFEMYKNLNTPESKVSYDVNAKNSSKEPK